MRSSPRAGLQPRTRARSKGDPLQLPHISKVAVLAIVVLIAAVLAIILYVVATLHSLLAPIALRPAVYQPPIVALRARTVSKDLLFYNSSLQVEPYLLIGYTSDNAMQIGVNATLLEAPPPSDIYIFNYSPIWCYDCGNAQAFAGMLANRLMAYGIIRNESSLNIITSPSSLLGIKNDSILIVLNGALPYYMMQSAGNRNETTLQYLLEKNTSIIIVAGANFTKDVSPGPALESSQAYGVVVPTFLNTTPSAEYKGLSNLRNETNASGIYFNNATFFLQEGANYGLVSYENYKNGSLVLFSNFLNSWPSHSDAANDIALSIHRLFWLKHYAAGSGIATLSSPGVHSGDIGVMLSPIALLNYSHGRNLSLESEISGLDAALSTSYGRVSIYAYSNASYAAAQASNTVYAYLNYSPLLHLNGSVSMPSYAIPGVSENISMRVFLSRRYALLPLVSLSVYNQNLTSTGITPFAQNLYNYSGAQIFAPATFYLPPGNYIAVLKSFSGTEYAAAGFSVPPITITPKNLNFSILSFSFIVSAGGVPLNGVPYSINLNGAYAQNGTISNGTVYYKLPSGAITLSGTSTFNLSLLGTTVRYSSIHYNPFAGTSFNIEDLIMISALVFVGIMLLVRSPIRDEFHIDVGELLPQQAIHITLEPQSIIQVFESMNARYKWSYMPLDTQEVRMGIASSIRYNNEQVNLTYANVDAILGRMSAARLLVSADGLYAPAVWQETSKHDIAYLATFKKLRIYFLTHAYMFTGIGASDAADLIATKGGEKRYVLIYSKTSRFIDAPIHTDAKTVLVFLNEDSMRDFSERLHAVQSRETGMLALYISMGYLILADADHLESAFS